MSTMEKLNEFRKQTYQFLDNVGFVLSNEEKEQIEVTDFGLNQLEKQGLQLFTYINSEHYCAKELILFPQQTCPEHKHPPVGEMEGKTETFRCRWGQVYLYVEGESKENIKAVVPKESKEYYTVYHEIVLNPGDQYTIPPNTLHWFQAGQAGAIITEFSTTSRDELDIFSNPTIIRVPQKGGTENFSP